VEEARDDRPIGDRPDVVDRSRRCPSIRRTVGGSGTEQAAASRSRFGRHEAEDNDGNDGVERLYAAVCADNHVRPARQNSKRCWQRRR